MPEAPITTTGTITGILGPTTCQVELPNGKVIVGHLPKRLNKIAGTLTPGQHVHLELTPYDFEKARLAGIVDDA
jgi:translation initiation factor IF-1